MAMGLCQGKTLPMILATFTLQLVHGRQSSFVYYTSSRRPPRHCTFTRQMKIYVVIVAAVELTHASTEDKPSEADSEHCQCTL
eukprot:361947-Chlamydomonas_euryale.AAC.11